MRTLLSSGYGAGVYGHVPLSRVVVSRPRRVGSAIEASGAGGLARSATTASTVVAVLAVVAAATAAVAVFVVVLFPIAAIGRAGRRGEWWLGHRGRNVGVERHQGSQRTRTIHVDLLQEEIVPNFEKVRKRRVALNDGAHVLESLVQPPKDVEDEDPVFDG
jgi:hypothetical protein